MRIVTSETQGATTPSRLLTIRTVADHLGLAPITIYKWVYSGRLASVKVGRARRIPATEVERLIREGFRAAGPPPLAAANRRLRTASATDRPL